MDNETIFSIATYGVIVGGLGLALTMALRLWHKRPHRRVVVLKPGPLTADQEADLIWVLNALDRTVATLEQDEAFCREMALGNDVVRLDEECRAVREAWEIIERKMPRKNDNRSRGVDV